MLTIRRAKPPIHLKKKKTSQECYQHLEITGEKKRKGRGGGDSSLGGSMVARGQKYYSLP